MLLALAAIPVIVSAVLSLVVRPVSRRLAPATAVRILVPASGITALATTFCLSVLAFNSLTEGSAIARLGHWIPTVDPDDGTPPPAAGAALSLLIMALLVATITRLVRVVVATVRAGLTVRRLAPEADGITILENRTADAFAVPGLPGATPRVVVTRGMLRALERDECAVLIAHERAHVANRHHLLVQSAELAARANPLLLPVARHVRILTERWADEDAAAEVGNRALAARAVAKAALARTSSLRNSPGMAALPERVATSTSGLNATTTGVPDRVRALSRRQSRPTARSAWPLVALGLAVVVASGTAAVMTQQKFERAASETIIVHGKVYWAAELGDHDGDDHRR